MCAGVMCIECSELLVNYWAHPSCIINIIIFILVHTCVAHRKSLAGIEGEMADFDVCV